MVFGVCLALSVCVFCFNEAQAGSIGYTGITSYMDWDADCSKPYEPSFYEYDQYAVDEFNRYVADVKNYIECIQNEAESDLNTLREAIVDSLDDQQSEAIQGVERLRNNLEMMR